MRKKRVLDVKKSPLELKKDFKPNNIFINDVDKFEEKNKPKRKRLKKNIW